MGEVIATCFAADECDDRKRADQGESIDRSVEKRGAETFAPAGDETKQGVARVRDGGISEEAPDIRLGERNEIAEQDRQRRQNRKQRRPARDHRLPARATLGRTEPDQNDFPENKKRRDLRPGSDEGRGRNRRALVGIWSPEMKRGCGDFESKTD